MRDRHKLALMPDNVRPLIKLYCLKDFDARLEGCLLSRHGVYVNDLEVPSKFHSIDAPLEAPNDTRTLYLGCCKDCNRKLYAKRSDAEYRKGVFLPPVNSIANGNWIGELPEEYKGYTRSDEQCLALMQACVYLSTIVGNAPSKLICSHGYIIKNPDAIINCIPKDVTGVVRMTLVGAFTSSAEAAVRKRYVLNHEINKKFLNEFLLVFNKKYIDHEIYINRDGFDSLDKDNCQIVDRIDGGQNPVNPSLIRIMVFDNTSHHNDNAQMDMVSVPDTIAASQKLTDSDAEPVSQEDEEIVGSSRTRILFSPPNIYNMDKKKVCFPASLYNSLNLKSVAS